MKYAAQEDALGGGALELLFEAAESLGLDGLEFWSAGLAERSEKLRGLSRLLGIRVCAVGAQLRSTLVSDEPDEVRWTAAELRRLLGLCARLGATGLVVTPAPGAPRFAEPLPPERARERARALFVDRVRDVARQAEAEGTLLLIEPTNRFESYFLNTLGEAAEVCQAVGAGLAICANLYHLRQTGDWRADLGRAAALVRHVRIADTGRLLPGRGKADLAGELGALRVAGYDGFVALDCLAPGQNAALKAFFQRELPAALARLKSG